jgi:hypothetical protein
MRWRNKEISAAACVAEEDGTLMQGGRRALFDAVSAANHVGPSGRKAFAAGVRSGF